MSHIRQVCNRLLLYLFQYTPTHMLHWQLPKMYSKRALFFVVCACWYQLLLLWWYLDFYYNTVLPWAILKFDGVSTLAWASAFSCPFDEVIKSPKTSNQRTQFTKLWAIVWAFECPMAVIEYTPSRIYDWFLMIF